MTVYPVQHFDPHTAHHSQEMKMFPISNQPNQTMSVSLSTPVHLHLASSAKSMAPSTMKPQSFGGVPVISYLSALHCSSSIVGTIDLRYPKQSF